jgi:penicillin-binding protein 1A
MESAKHKLTRTDIVGKKGMTANQYDAWYAGYSPDMVTITWVGFDSPRSLGYRETSEKTALPLWIEFMAD